MEIVLLLRRKKARALHNRERMGSTHGHIYAE